MRISLFVSFLFMSTSILGQIGIGLKFDYLMAAEPNSVVSSTFDIADFDNDGDQDYVTTFTVSGVNPYIGIVWNTNNEFFEEVEIEPTLSEVEDIQAHDFNNDGLPDIIMDGSKFWKNLGNRQFEKVEIESSFTFAPGYFVTDFDEDGLLDVIVPTQFVGGGIFVLMNQGNFEFIENHLIVSSSMEHPVYYADMDLDGQRDIIIRDNQKLKICFNDNGNFERDTIIANSVGVIKTVQDLTNDGYPDVVYTMFNTCHFLFNDQCQNFPSQLLMNKRPEHADVFDVNMDGKLDLVIAPDELTKISWCKNNGDSTFASPQDFPGGTIGTMVRPGDFNGDQKMDLFAVLDANSGLLGVYVNENDSTGTNGAGIPNDSLAYSRLAHFGHGGQITQHRVVDVDGDGDLDVVATNINYEEAAWWDNQNDSLIKRVIFQGNISSNFLVTGDFDNNGTTDIIVHDKLHSDNNEPSLLGFFQDLEGAFHLDTVLTLPNTQSIGAIQSGDFTNDGKTDVVIRLVKNGKVYTELHELGAGNELNLTWSKIVDIKGDHPEILDLDLDGNLDMIWPGHDGTALIWLKGDGTGAFTDSIVTSTEGGIQILHATDYDQDGDMDFISDAPTEKLVLLWENNGDHTFSVDTIYTIPLNQILHNFTSGDADNDGDIDFFISLNHIYGPCILENTSDSWVPHFINPGAPEFIDIIPIGDESSMNFIGRGYSYISRMSTCTFTNLDLSKADSSFCMGDTLSFDFWLHNTSANRNYHLYDDDNQLIKSYPGSADSTKLEISQFTPMGSNSIPHHYFLKGDENGCSFSYTDTISILPFNTPQINPFSDQTTCQGEEVFVKTGLYGFNNDIATWYENGEEGYNLVFHDTTFVIHAQDTLTGCYNTDTLFVSVIDSIKTIAHDTICPSEDYLFGDLEISDPGTYEYAYVSSIGCDSTVILHLENWDIEVPSITLVGTDSLVTQEGYEEYTWIICPDEEEVADNSGTNIYEPNTTGSYTVRIKKDGCTIYSNCFFFEYIGINELENINHLISYIDGNGMLHIQLKSEAPSGKIHLLDANGRILQTANIQNLKEFNMDMKGYSTGIYFVFVEGFAPVKLMRTGL